MIDDAQDSRSSWVKLSIVSC